MGWGRLGWVIKFMFLSVGVQIRLEWGREEKKRERKEEEEEEEEEKKSRT